MVLSWQLQGIRVSSGDEGSRTGEGTVITADIEAVPGVVHTIDTVLVEVIFSPPEDDAGGRHSGDLLETGGDPGIILPFTAVVLGLVLILRGYVFRGSRFLATD